MNLNRTCVDCEGPATLYCEDCFVYQCEECYKATHAGEDLNWHKFQR